MEIENVKITDVSLSMADHGCLTFDIAIKGNGFGCTIGGYCIGHGYLGADEFIAENGHGLNLKGKYCRIKTDGWGSIVKVIGNIIEDKWFDIGKFFEEKQKEIGMKNVLEYINVKTE